MKLEVKIEIRSIVKKLPSPSAGGNTHDFSVFVQGLNGYEIEHFVKQVVFYLPSNSKQVKGSPPYMISGSTNASFRLPIEILLHTSDAHNNVRYSYYVYLPDKPVESAVIVKTLKFLNAPPDFRQRLLLGGAEVVKEPNCATIGTQRKSDPDERTENQVTNVQNEVANIPNKVQNELPNSCIQTEDILEQNGILLIQDIYSFDDLMKENELLKKENEELLQKFNKHEGVVTTYVEKLLVLQHDFSVVGTEFSHLKQKSEDIDAEIPSLKSSVEKLMSQVLQQNNKVNEVKRLKKSPRKMGVVAQDK